MAGKNQVLTGKIHWAKVLGDPVPNYDGDENEWTFELSPNEKGIDLLNRLGVGDKIKNKNDEKGQYVTFKRNAVNKGTDKPNNPIPVFDAEGAEWPQDVKIGNGSSVIVKFGIFEGKWKTKSYTKLIPYEIKVIELVKVVLKGNSKVAPAGAEELNKSVKPNAKGNEWETTES